MHQRETTSLVSRQFLQRLYESRYLRTYLHLLSMESFADLLLSSLSGHYLGGLTCMDMHVCSTHEMHGREGPMQSMLRNSKVY